MRDVVVVSAVRTAIGTFGGSLKDVPPIELGTTVVREALSRAQVNGVDVGHVVFGHVVNTEPKDMYLSRVAAIQAGCGQETPAFNVNRLCGSGLQAIVSAAQAIQLGDCDIAIGGGAENMSRAPFASLNMRWGSRMGDSKMVDMMVGALHDPFQTIHMGVTAENIAKNEIHATIEEDLDPDFDPSDFHREGSIAVTSTTTDTRQSWALAGSDRLGTAIEELNLIEQDRAIGSRVVWILGFRNIIYHYG